MLAVKDDIIGPYEINYYFWPINTEPEILSIPDGTRIPKVSSLIVSNYLFNLKRTAAGPDQPFLFGCGETLLLT